MPIRYNPKVKLIPYKDKGTKLTFYRADYSITYPEGGMMKRQRRRVGGFLTKSDALEFATEEKRAARRGELKPEKPLRQITLQELVETFKQRKRPTVGAHAMRRYNNVLKKFAAFAGESKPVSQITLDTITLYVTGLQTEGKLTCTINREVSAINAMLANAPYLFPAELRDWTPPKAKRFPEQPRGANPMEPEEAARLQEALYSLDRDVADVFVIALRTSKRLSEILRLRWRDVFWRCVGFDDGAIRFSITKTNRAYKDDMIPLTPTLTALLRARRDRLQPQSDDTHIFPSRQKKGGHLSTATIHIVFTKARAVARAQPGRRFHDTRGTFENWLRRKGYGLEVICDIAGHDPQTYVKHYSKTTTAHKQAALDEIERMAPPVATFSATSGFDSVDYGQKSNNQKTG